MQAALATAREAHKAQEASLTRAAGDVAAQHARQTQRAAEAESLVEDLQQRLTKLQACAVHPCVSACVSGACAVCTCMSACLCGYWESDAQWPWICSAQQWLELHSMTCWHLMLLQAARHAAAASLQSSAHAACMALKWLKGAAPGYCLHA